MPGEGRFIDKLAKGEIDVENNIRSRTGTLIANADSNHVHCLFNTTPLTVKKVGAGAATGTAGDENLVMCGGVTWEQHVLGTQTIIAPSLGTGGLNIVQDEAENDGVEYSLGINAHNRGVFVVGTSDAFFARMKFSIDDVSGTDDCAFGFRKLEAYQAAIDNYDEMAAFNVISGNIKLETVLNGAATTTTDTTDDWADGETHELEVRVSAAGVVTYRLDGAEPTTVAAFTFDDAEVVIPFFYLLAAADPEVAAVVLKEFECGLQANRA